MTGFIQKLVDKVEGKPEYPVVIGHPLNQPEPSVEEIQQQRDPISLSPIPVTISEFADVRTLPSKHGKVSTYWMNHNTIGYGNFAGLSSGFVIPADPKIRRAIVEISQGGIWFGTYRELTGPSGPVNNTEATVGYFMAVTGQRIWEGFSSKEDEIWAFAPTAIVTDTAVSIRLEFWAD